LAASGWERPEPTGNRREDRRRLKLLDACLDALEDAHERDEITVSRRLAVRLRQVVPDIEAGMPIVDAIELVFREQEPCLVGVQGQQGASPSDADRPGPLPQEPDPMLGVIEGGRREALEPLDADGARELTQRIKMATRAVCELLLEAHQRHIWPLLGYPTWERYVHTEFGLSRSRSYELLDQGRVIKAIRTAAGMSGIPDISAHAASQLKPHLREVVQLIRVRTEGVSQEDAADIVAEVVRQQRGLLPGRRGRVDGEPAIAAADVERFYDAIEKLARMPPVADTIAELSGGAAPPPARILVAYRWLTEFAQEWSRRRSDAMPLEACLRTVGAESRGVVDLSEVAETRSTAAAGSRPA
jgi:hypothetical protein